MEDYKSILVLENQELDGIKSKLQNSNYNLISNITFSNTFDTEILFIHGGIPSTNLHIFLYHFLFLHSLQAIFYIFDLSIIAIFSF